MDCIIPVLSEANFLPIDEKSKALVVAAVAAIVSMTDVFICLIIIISRSDLNQLILFSKQRNQILLSVKMCHKQLKSQRSGDSRVKILKHD